MIVLNKLIKFESKLNETQNLKKIMISLEEFREQTLNC